ncbi:hypothetical protein [uncultured Chitinophaga sp.]|jgi:hypothetical protein|uniref:hypothetical protein n=1 Tax=uncultured Chitinophaga sp. TaxID=339340 RepID=UPI00261C267F|nr:hypothetical protein [uncultured Chitinophaga sp.]
MYTAEATLMTDAYRNMPDTLFWKQFMSLTNDLTQTAVVKDALQPAHVELMNRHVMEALAMMCRRRSSMQGLRVYVDNAIQDEAYKTEYLFPYVPEAGEDIISWSARVFGEKKFGLIINQIEKFSGDLARYIVMLVKPLLDITGIPQNGFHTSTFIGNYGYTPLGIHQDHRGSCVIHFHLGPGGKTMYTWDERAYYDLCGGKQNNMDIVPLLPSADRYAFGQGDIYFMPWNSFHVGYTEALSIGVTFWFDNHLSSVIVDKLFDMLKAKYVNLRDKTITVPERRESNFSGFPDIARLLRLDDFSEGVSFTELFRNIYEESWLTIKSNGGWRFRPLSRRAETGYDENDYLHFSGKTVCGVYPFEIKCKTSPTGDVFLYSRGAEFQMKYHQGIITIINKLNTHTPVPVADLISELDGWPVDARLYFISVLYNNKAIEVI